MIEIRNLNYTRLNHYAFKKIAQKYARYLKLEHKILIVFDKRLTKNGGYHDLDYSKKRHRIQLCPHPDGAEPNAVKWSLISFLLHELKHAQQIEKGGYHRHISKAYSSVEEIEDTEWSEYYSDCETEARTYQNQHVRKAVDFYNSMVK